MSVVHRYQPFPKRECTTTPEEMMAKLNSRVDQRSARVAHNHEVAGSNPAPAKPLEWEKPAKDATGIKTKCGRYSCAKITLDGKVSYELWKLAPGAGWFRQLNKGLDNFLQVQKLAQIDADKGTP